MMTKISQVLAREALDSRGNPTLECEVVLQNGSCGRALVPSGASTGMHEAKELRDGGKRYLGLGVLNAVTNVRKALAPKLLGVDARDQKALDALLVVLDGTPDKHKFGANALLGISLAAAKACATSENKPLYSYLHALAGSPSVSLPVPFANIINGGKHAGNALAIQEFMIAPVGAKNFSEATRMTSEIYHTLKAKLEARLGKHSVNVGDEGGFAPSFTKTEEALEAIWGAIEELGYASQVKLALDAASTSFYKDGRYAIDGKSMTAADLHDYYGALISKYKIVSLEDPFQEEDFASFASFHAAFPKLQVVADDLTVTNPAFIRIAAEQKAANCLLLKVNQIGTLSESLDAAKLARRSLWQVMVSHRSGETEDTFIADLAVALDAHQIKLGAPARGERTAKYNRLLRIEEELGANGHFGWLA